MVDLSDDLASNGDRKWFENAGLGLFTHWGLSSVSGKTDLSWGMLETIMGTENDRHLPPAEYYAQAEAFDPVDYDPDRWLSAAGRAGVEYAVLTAKHHEGFAMWPSEYGEFGVAEYADGRDLVGEFVAACRRYDIRPGLYFSLPDWHHEDWPDLEEFESRLPEYHVRPTEEFPPSWPTPEGGLEASGEQIATELPQFEHYFSYLKGQLTELATGYDLDLFWFDHWPWFGYLDNRIGELYDLVRSAQPGIVMNGRGEYEKIWGDYETPENTGRDVPSSETWERCQVWAPPGWGYVEDESYRDFAWTIEQLARTVSMGGNLLLNVGPKGNGQLPEMAYDRLKSLEAWMGHSGCAVKRVDHAPWPARSGAPVTRRGDCWYLHVLQNHGPSVEVRDVPEPRSVRLLRTGEHVAYEHDEMTLSLEVSTDRRASPDEVVVISWPRQIADLL